MFPVLDNQQLKVIGYFSDQLDIRIDLFVLYVGEVIALVDAG